MSLISLVFHSGYGRTKKQAKAVAQILKTVDETEIRLIEIDQQGEISGKDWLSLNTSDAIVFGSPTYMGLVSLQFKKFVDTSSKFGASNCGRINLPLGSPIPRHSTETRAARLTTFLRFQCSILC